MITSPPANSSNPSTISVTPAGSSRSDSAPTARSAATPGLASAFMTTSDHSPSLAGQVRVWVPGPDAEATQKVCSSGGDTVRVPNATSVSVRNGQYATPSTRSYAVPASHVSTCPRGPIPTNSGASSAPVARTRTVPIGSRSAHSPVRSSALPTSTGVSVWNRSVGVV
jgi:hypothetical protein